MVYPPPLSFLDVSWARPCMLWPCKKSEMTSSNSSISKNLEPEIHGGFPKQQFLMLEHCRRGTSFFFCWWWVRLTTFCLRASGRETGRHHSWQLSMHMWMCRRMGCIIVIPFHYSACSQDVIVQSLNSKVPDVLTNKHNQTHFEWKGSSLRGNPWKSQFLSSPWQVTTQKTSAQMATAQTTTVLRRASQLVRAEKDLCIRGFPKWGGVPSNHGI